MRPRVSSLRRLLQMGILLVLAVSAALVFGSLFMTSQISQSSALTTHTYEVMLHLRDLKARLYELEAEERAYWYTGQTEFVDRHKALIGEINKLVDLVTKETADNPDQREHNSPTLVSQVRDRRDLSNAIVAMQRRGETARVKEMVLSREPRTKMDDALLTIEMMQAVEQKLLAVRRDEMERAQKGMMWLLILGLLGCVFLGSLVLFRLSRRLEPLADCATMADKIGKGDLSLQPLPVRVEDEVGTLTRRLNEMLESLRLLTVQNRGAAEKLGGATRTILAAARDQAVYVQQQAAAVQETSATMEELGQSANHISERARDVVARAEATSKASDLGLQAVEENVRSTASTLEQVRVVASKILSLSEKTQAIGDIVSTVNDLSERSNVLALNAAILAAASPEGKTFSVVANEMKSLAEQSKDATTQVRGLLGDIERGIQACVFLTEEAVKRGEAGSIYTDQVNASIRNLAGSIQESLQAFQQIVAATDQQRTASDHVNSALWSIRQASDQTAVGTQKFESSARELHELSQALLATMERYRLRHETS